MFDVCMSYKDMKYILIFAPMRLKSFITLLLCLCAVSDAFAQGWNVIWKGAAFMSGGSEEVLPFWAYTGRNGVLPATSAATVTLGAEMEYGWTDGFFLEGAADVAGFVAENPSVRRAEAHGIVDRLYVSAGWKMLRADVGMLPRQRELGDLSITGGNMMWTSNARNIPGLNVRTDWIYLLERLAFRGNIAHYQMTDRRSVAGAMLHDKSLEIKLRLTETISLSGGLEHIAQWGGVSASYGPQPSSLRDYMRVFFAQGGGEGASSSDRINVLGNHLGREYIRMDWTMDKTSLVFQYDKPFEDGSGLRMQNFPDGVWTMKMAFNDRKAFLTDLVCEFINTTWQSGPLHDRPATEEEMSGQDPSDPYYGRVILRGRDNYFNNSMYRSGWTCHGRVIGLPLIGGLAYEDDGTVAGILCNRVRALHIGAGGNLAEDLPYMFKATYSRNYGRYDQPESSLYANAPWQLSMAVEVGLSRKLTGLPAGFMVGVYSDIGRLYPDSFGITLKVDYSVSRNL